MVIKHSLKFFKLLYFVAEKYDTIQRGIWYRKKINVSSMAVRDGPIYMI